VAEGPLGHVTFTFQCFSGFYRTCNTIIPSLPQRARQTTPLQAKTAPEVLPRNLIRAIPVHQSRALLERMKDARLKKEQATSRSPTGCWLDPAAQAAWDIDI
jgi:hypothetical protein